MDLFDWAIAVMIVSIVVAIIYWILKIEAKFYTHGVVVIARG